MILTVKSASPVNNASSPVLLALSSSTRRSRRLLNAISVTEIHAVWRPALKMHSSFYPSMYLGQAQRMTSVLKYVHMKEVEYVEKGERKVLRYADIEKGKAED